MCSSCISPISRSTDHLSKSRGAPLPLAAVPEQRTPHPEVSPDEIIYMRTIRPVATSIQPTAGTGREEHRSCQGHHRCQARRDSQQIQLPAYCHPQSSSPETPFIQSLPGRMNIKLGWTSLVRGG